MNETEERRSSELPTAARFTGPVFVVGLPRSGTKLLRDLLRGHSRIRIPSVETNLLPRWATEWNDFGDLSDRRRFAAFYRWNLRGPYFLYLGRHPQGPIPEDVWYRSIGTFTPAGVFEALLRHDVGAPPDSDFVWGDKSPDHVRHIDLLAELFPAGRFVHIVRDVRDYCLSVRRRSSASVVRAAQLWVDGVAKARRDGDGVSERYLEVRYEDLIEAPERELRRCCEFLDLEFDLSLVTLRFSSEHTGDAKGATEVVSGNTRKYLQGMDERTARRIEEIAGPALREFGYGVEYSGPARKVPKPMMSYYRLVDGLNYARRQGRRIGFLRHAQIQLGRLMRN